MKLHWDGVSKPETVQALTELGRVRLSKSFFFRDFLHSEIASIHGIPNVPDDPPLAIEMGRKLCEDLLEPLQDRFGRIAIRSGYRSPALNHFGWERMRAGEWGYNCSSNRRNAAHHIWDQRDEQGHGGAMACIIIPSLLDRLAGPGEWQKLAWFIHDNLNYSRLTFFTTLMAFNIGWHERPEKRIDSYIAPRGVLTAPGNEPQRVAPGPPAGS